ncbi:hypothetical protein E4U17_001695 [Claviceps sp. LM77 group G4]|nr:hypothetical protein E4U17_001695 [Claviceps sp. LM77 group G4]KAG6074004.1 hypothetical protein E4U33_002678 [Claviceps sp. LM78 group G4]KAG6083122.1 hypothetical protein E4U16_004869 [Claviceps sp. LM84 group G4]
MTASEAPPVSSANTTSPPPPSSLPPSSSSRPPTDKAVSLSALVASTPSRIDAFLTHLSQCMQTRTGAETVLLFACYATRLSGSLLETLGSAPIRQSARRLLALALALAYKPSPASTIIKTSSTLPRPSLSLASLALQLGARLKTLSGLISETRTMARLWGLLGLYLAAKKLVRKSLAAKRHSGETGAEKNALRTARSRDVSSECTFDTLVAYAQLASLLVFQATENVSFLSSKNVLPLAGPLKGRLALLSVRAWGLYVAMEAARLLVERSRKKEEEGKLNEDSKGGMEWEMQWKKSFYRNLAWAPLTLHWGSNGGGFLPDVAVSVLGFYPALGAMMDLWRDTAVV